LKDYNGIINLNQSDNDYIVYKIYSINNSDKSIYIGVTEDDIARIKKHNLDRKRKSNSHKPLYTWMNDIIDFKKLKVVFEIIERGLTKEESFLKEEHYIRLYKELGFTLLNLTNGGKGVKGRSPWNKGLKNPYSEEQLKNLSISHIGISNSSKGKTKSNSFKLKISKKNKERIGKEWNSPKRKNVLKYSKEMELISTYTSLRHASQFENAHPVTIGEWCRGEKNPRNGFIYKYQNL
jgi:hypothetical protein